MVDVTRSVDVMSAKSRIGLLFRLDRLLLLRSVGLAFVVFGDLLTVVQAQALFVSPLAPPLAVAPVDGKAKTAGNNFFQVVKSGSQWKLLTKIRFDYEKQRVHSIVVIATDSAGNVTKKQFRISILNVLDPK